MSIARHSLTMLMAILFIAAFTGCKEPSYQGIGLKHWEQLLSAEDPAIRADAAKAIGGIGKDAKAAIERLHSVASNDAIPAVRLAAINALKEIGAPTAEFDAYVKEVTAPLVPTDDSEMGDQIGSSGTDLDQSQNGGSSSAEDDLDYLKNLEEGPDSLGVGSNAMPKDEEAQQEWVQGRRKEAISSLLQEIQDPGVLAEMLNTGDATQKRFAARLLQNNEGGQNADVVDALTRAKADSDSVLKNIAIEALKKWSNP